MPVKSNDFTGFLVSAQETQRARVARVFRRPLRAGSQHPHTLSVNNPPPQAFTPTVDDIRSWGSPAAFDAAAISLREDDTARMAALRRELTGSADQVARAFGYTRAYTWSLDPSAWFEDPLINEYNEIDWR